MFVNVTLCPNLEHIKCVTYKVQMVERLWFCIVSMVEQQIVSVFRQISQICQKILNCFIYKVQIGFANIIESANQLNTHVIFRLFAFFQTRNMYIGLCQTSFLIWIMKCI